MTAVAIIGAGMAGLATAERLRAGGMSCVIFEKSRGMGGRMSTRRTGDLQFDHGAQYFTARGPDFVTQVARWREAGVVAEWAPGSHVGAPGMTAPARALASRHVCVTQAQVNGFTRTADGWTVLDDKGSIKAQGNGAYAAIVLAVPAPQAIPLAARAGADMPELAGARYAPCIALMLAFPADVDPVLPDWSRPDDAAIAWIAADFTKPGRPQAARTFVVHARPDWSRAHIDDQAEDLVAPLLARFRAVTGLTAEPAYASAHRWRYALVEQEIGLPCLFDAGARVGACGDWCLGPRVEAAWDSGCAMADTLLTALA